MSKLLEFKCIKFTADELHLENVLQCGQAFRWVFHEKLGHYSTTLKVGDRFRIVVVKQSEKDCIQYASLGKDGSEECAALYGFLKRYFRLEVPLGTLLKTEWLMRDSRFKHISPKGVRILAQDPWETLCSFICSSNNNIARITKMCHALSTEFGNLVGHYDGVDHYSFPTSRELTQRASEESLRVLGFGYRAKYIMATAKKIEHERLHLSDSEYLQSWKDNLEYEQIREKMMSFHGVGPKVADCVCLSGLQMDDVVPVDVHIARIAQRDYKFSAGKQDIMELQTRYRELPITRKKVNYELDVIRSRFKEKWGNFAGWAQGIVFAQEVGKTSGATSESTAIKRRLEFAVKIEGQEQQLLVKKQNLDMISTSAIEKVVEEKIEYTITGRPKRKTASNVTYGS
ncbi:LADA_0H14488g1_1 [Lachancea dasiensis]|uniref:DNA-(apurinic or apyrimidinic site) lyase n=1 Tax=Lachancea dasiensis TaxID=1072105 RepID=A0A1G4K4G0_9SACH|nr:LADA_0H14488g1_1 [Lachancea dasiensis]